MPSGRSIARPDDADVGMVVEEVRQRVDRAGVRDHVGVGDQQVAARRRRGRAAVGPAPVAEVESGLDEDERRGPPAPAATMPASPFSTTTTSATPLACSESTQVASASPAW